MRDEEDHECPGDRGERADEEAEPEGGRIRNYRAAQVDGAAGQDRRHHGSGDGGAHRPHESVDADTRSGVGRGGVAHYQRGHRRVGDTDSGARDDAGDHELPRSVHEEHRDEVAGGDDDSTDGQGYPGAEPGDHGAGYRGERHHHQAAGRHPEPGREDGLSQSVAGGLRNLQQLRDHDGLCHHAESDEDRGDVGEEDRPVCAGALIDQRRGDTQLVPAPEQQDDEPAEDAGHGRARGPAPFGPLAHSDEGAAYADGQADDRDEQSGDEGEARPGGRGILGGYVGGRLRGVVIVAGEGGCRRGHGSFRGP